MLQGASIITDYVVENVGFTLSFEDFTKIVISVASFAKWK